MRVGTQSAALLPVLAVLVAGAVWGLFWLPMRALENTNLPGDWLTLLLFAVPASVLLPVVLWRHRTPRGLLTRSVLTTGLFTSAGLVLYAVSLVLTTVIKALLLFYLTPLWSTLLGYLILDEKITPARIVSLIAGLLGLVVILESGGIPMPANLGDWMALLSGIVWAYGTVRLHSQQTVPLHESLFAFFVGGVLIACVIIVLPINAFAALPDASEIIRLLPWIALIGTGFILATMVLVYWGALRLSPARVGLLLMAEVVVGVVSAAWFTEEPFGARELTGSVLIIGAALLEVLQRDRVHT